MVVKLTPKWDVPTKAGNDKNGWKRGARGIDGAFDADGTDFLKTADPAADAKIYGPTTRGPRPDGAQAVQSNVSQDPGVLRDTFKGSVGIDSPALEGDDV